MTRSDKKPSRPKPPATLLDVGIGGPHFAAAPELHDWVQSQIVEPNGALHNPDHAHLDGADLAFLWTSSGYAKAGRTVLGTAEQVMLRAGGWQKLRQEDWFVSIVGRVPDFLITLAADYCEQASDVEFCTLVEHELYHVGQPDDEFGNPAFHKDGRPKLAIRGHDVEEFVGVVRRYGPSPDVGRLIDAAKGAPAVPRLNIARACGCCLKVA